MRPLIALVVALAVGGWLVLARTPAPLTGALSTVTRPHAIASGLPDGAAYTPLFYADAGTSVGSAPTPDGAAERLVLRTAAAVTELRRVEQSRYPQFLGFTAAGGTLYWAESSATPLGPYETRIWRAPLDGSAPPVSLTTDAGAAVFFDSEYDLVVADGRLHWIAATPDDAPRTQLRSVALTGGPVEVTVIDGRFRRTAWPWLQSVEAPLRLVNRQTGERRTVSVSAVETVTCTPTWCRSMVREGVFDALHPDGSARRRIPGNVNAVTGDVAVAGNYELFTTLDGERLRLIAYDLRTGAVEVLASDVGVTAARAGVVWWSDAPQTPSAWRSLDLRALG